MHELAGLRTAAHLGGARDVRGDMTLMRTVGATAEMPLFTGRIGFRPDEVATGMQVITSGYPNGGRLITDSGDAS